MDAQALTSVPYRRAAGGIGIGIGGGIGGGGGRRRHRRRRAAAAGGGGGRRVVRPDAIRKGGLRFGLKTLHGCPSPDQRKRCLKTAQIQLDVF